MNKLVSRLHHEIDGTDETIQRLQQCKPSLVANKLQTSTYLKKFDQGIMNTAVMERSLECVFQNVMEEFGDKTDLLDVLEEEAKNLSHTNIVGLEEKIDGLKKANSQLQTKALFLQFYIDELREEVALLQENDVMVFGEYQDLKKDYNILLLQMVEKDERLFRGCRIANKVLN